MPGSQFMGQTMAIGDSLRTMGLATTISYAAARASAASRVFDYHSYLIIAVPRQSMPQPPRGYDVREIDAATLSTFNIDASLQVQQARFDSGLTCIGAFEGDNLVGVNWLGTESHVEDEVHIRYLLPEDAAWDTGLWIRPERRLSRTFAALWSGSAKWLETRRLNRSMSRIADYNSASLSAHRRMSAEVVGTLTVLGVGGWQLATVARPALIRISGEPATVDLRRR